MLKGRLGLETARIPHADRHGLLWLSRGELCVVDGCLHFLRGRDSLTPGIDQIPHQAVSMILLGPGSSVTHDALRLLARHGTLLAPTCPTRPSTTRPRRCKRLPLLPCSRWRPCHHSASSTKILVSPSCWTLPTCFATP